jgi:hypothetical protein
MNEVMTLEIKETCVETLNLSLVVRAEGGRVPTTIINVKLVCSLPGECEMF